MSDYKADSQLQCIWGCYKWQAGGVAGVIKAVEGQAEAEEEEEEEA